MEFIEVAKLDEVSEDSMKHLEIKDKEILLANVGGKIYAMDDRCGHMNVSLSAGILENKIVTCPLHKAQFDVTTGKNVKGPHIPKIINSTKMGKLMSNVKVLNQKTYEVKVEDNTVKIGI